MTDLQIIGAGPAGLSAALYAARAGLSVRLFDRMGGGGQLYEAAMVENYPGTGRIRGNDLAAQFLKEATAAGAELVTGEVTHLSREHEGFAIRAGERHYLSKTVILANGAAPRHLGVAGEREFLGRGVSYCAVCDGRFFGGKTVAVIGGGESAVGEALYLSQVAAKVYLVHRRTAFRATTTSLRKIEELPTVVFRVPFEVSAIEGNERVTHLVLSEKGSGKKETISVDGVFVAVGREPQNALFSHLYPVDDEGYVCASEDGSCGVEGLFAAGDTRKKALRQLVTAASDGANAAEAVRRYLAAGKTGNIYAKNR